jgi:urease accessory protein
MQPLVLLRLMQLFDSQFPVGAFAHSGGLETYGQAGAGIATVRELMTTQIALGWGRSEIAAACLAWSASAAADSTPRLADLSARVGASKVVPAIRDASVRLGRRTMTLLRRLYPEVFASFDVEPPHQAIVIGAAGYRLDLPLRDLLLAYAHSLLAGGLAASTRCMPLSPAQAQALIVELHPHVERAVEHVLLAPNASLFTCTPALDIRCHQQGLLTTRLFQS